MYADREQIIASLTRAQCCGHDFIPGKTGYQKLYAMAAYFRSCFLKAKDRSLPVCLAAEDRTVIAAAVLAAFSSGTTLALPHSFSSMALEEMQNMTGFCSAVVDCQRRLPTSVATFFPETEEKATEISFAQVSLRAELLSLFTGGSTGSPKIWSKTAANIFSEALFMVQEFGIVEEDTLAATISPCHIYGLLFSVIVPLMASASVLAETPLFPAEIAECVKKNNVTVFISVPAHYRVLNGRKTSEKLRIAFSSAGMLAEEDSLAFSKQNKVPVVEVYGSTETGGLASRNRFACEKYFTPLKPVRWQIRGQRLYVQSPFISPDVPVNKENLFLSGDKVRSCGETCFSLHGRADAVTKVGGERVDLDEVRDVLQQQPGVKECVVIGIADKTGRGNRIGALVRGEGIQLTRIRKELPSLLETAALPRILKETAAIPTTGSGKYDREAILRLLT